MTPSTFHQGAVAPLSPAAPNFDRLRELAKGYWFKQLGGLLPAGCPFGFDCAMLGAYDRNSSTLQGSFQELADQICAWLDEEEAAVAARVGGGW